MTEHGGNTLRRRRDKRGRVTGRHASQATLPMFHPSGVTIKVGGLMYTDVHPSGTTDVRYRSPLRLQFSPVLLLSQDE